MPHHCDHSAAARVAGLKSENDRPVEVSGTNRIGKEKKKPKDHMHPGTIHTCR